jgi:ornithine cyclodeaminase/alanine dehydrogenase-like protein (mu-crystallin family)
LAQAPYEAAVLGIGPIGIATVFALAALPVRPTAIRLAAKSSRGFASVTERIGAYIGAELGEITGLGVHLVPCEDIPRACAGAQVIIDCTSAPKRRPVLGAQLMRERDRLVMVDVGKYALDVAAVETFPRLIFDSLVLTELPSPASDYCRAGGIAGEELSSFIRQPGPVPARVLFTVLGVPVIDTLLAEAIVAKL